MSSIKVIPVSRRFWYAFCFGQPLRFPQMAISCLILHEFDSISICKTVAVSTEFPGTNSLRCRSLLYSGADHYEIFALIQICVRLFAGTLFAPLLRGEQQQ